MAKVMVTESYLEDIADAIRAKKGVATTYKPGQMASAISSIAGEPTLQTKSVSYTPSTTAVSDTITADSGYDGLEEVDVTVSAVSVGELEPSMYIVDDNPTITVNSTGLISVSGGYSGDVYPVRESGWIDDSEKIAVDSIIVGSSQLSTQSAKTVTPTESQQTAVTSGKYTTGDVTVSAIPSDYVGSGITQRSGSDLTASGATVTVPSGYYSSNATKSVTSGSATGPSSLSGSSATITTGTNTITLTKTGVTTTPTVSAGYVSSATASTATVALTASVTVNPTPTASGATVTIPAGYYSTQTTKSVANGSAGTPTATKGTVSNHSISITPSVTNTTGYITGDTKTGTTVTVSASELVSGTYSVTSSGTKDVTNYASASVPSGTEGTPTATKGTVSNHSVSVTPSVTNASGFIAGGTKTGTAVTVSASELVSGSQTVTENDTYDVTNLAELVVNVSGGSGGYVTQDQDGYIVLPPDGEGGGGSSGSGDEYTRTVIVPEQTVTAGSNRQAALSNYTGTLEAAKHYIVTLDGVEWYTTCKNLWTNNYTIGEAAWFIASNPSINDLVYPFGAIYDTTEFAVALPDQNQHTVKIENLVLVEKTIVEIPLNMELIDYTKVTRGYVINENGELDANEWQSYSDYTPISSSMTFSYTGIYWFYLAFYTSSKEFIRSISISKDSTVDPNDSNVGHGTLSGSKIPSMAAYIRITGGYNANNSNLSLIRTA